MDEEIIIGPQPGPQTQFLECEADICIYGGAAGGGKTVGLLLDPLRHYDNSEFGATIFRRTSVQVRNMGGLWDESEIIYRPLNGIPRRNDLEWTFPSGMRVEFNHLEYDKDVYKLQGAQFPWAGFDELTHFSEFQFWYVFSRLRSVSGVKSCVRCTTNPDPDSWVRRLIDWWIGPDGFPLKARAGKLRWFIRIGNKFYWADTPGELIKKYGKDQLPTSLTFIPSKLEDNRILMEKDPRYKTNLMAMSLVDRERLHKGNWNIRPTGGLMFKREWFKVIDVVPDGWIDVLRFWDTAATEVSPESPDPDWTRGLKIYKYPNGKYLIADLRSIRATSAKVETFIQNVASHDGVGVRIMKHQDPGSAGKKEAYDFTTMLAGYQVKTEPGPRMQDAKVVSAKTVSAQAEHQNISILRADWNEDFFSEVENFPPDKEKGHDDIVDTLSGGFNDLNGLITSMDATDAIGRLY